MWVRTRVRLKGRTAACCAAHRATTCCDAARRAAHHAAVRLTAARRAVSDAHDASPWCHPMRPRFEGECAPLHVDRSASYIRAGSTMTKLAHANELDEDEQAPVQCIVAATEH